MISFIMYLIHFQDIDVTYGFRKGPGWSWILDGPGLSQESGFEYLVSKGLGGF